MIRTHRQFASLVVSLLAVGVFAAAIASACSPDATIGVDAAVVEPGKTVTITGAGFVATVAGSPAPANVELRWDSAGGPVLAHALGPNFSVRVQIPQTSPAEHQVFAVGYHPATGAVIGQHSSMVRVGEAPASQPQGGSSSAQTSGGQSQPAAKAPAKPAPAAQPAASPQNQTSASTSGRESAPAKRVKAAATAPIGIPSSPNRVVATGGRSVPGAGSPEGRAATAGERSAFSDAWSAFAGPSPRSLIGRHSEAIVPASGSSQATALVLFAFGFLSLLAGALLLRSRRGAFLRIGRRPPTD